MKTSKSHNVATSKLKTAAKILKPKTEVFDFSGKDVLDKIISGVVRIADPDKIILFGSRATGKARKDSDYDILVLKKNCNQKTLLNEIYSNGIGAGVPVDVLVNTPERFEELKTKLFFVYSDIAKNGKVIYEKQN